MNKQEINKSRQECISCVKDVCGKNSAYFSPDKCIYYSPNRTIDRKINPSKICHSNLKDLMKAVKLFKSENPEQKVKIIRL